MKHLKLNVKDIKHLIASVKKLLSRGLKDKDFHLRLLATIPLLLCIFLTLLAYSGLNDTIPLWYTKPWGNQVFASSVRLFVIPIGSFIFTVIAFTLAYFSKKFYFTYLAQILLVGAIFFNVGCLVSVARVIYIASKTSVSITGMSLQTQNLIMLLAFGFLSSYVVIPKFISWAFKNNLVTDPSQHKHPGMILTKPSARGGGFLFALLFSGICLIFLEKSPTIIGIAVATFISGLIGLLDDFQNTNPQSKLSFLENPIIRLFVFLPIPIVLMMLFGIVSGYINNPFDGSINLTQFKINIFGDSIVPLPFIFTLMWTLAIMNMISWSNGVDGQFGGIAGISTLIIGILALRLVETEPSQINTAKLAFLAAGISFGFIPHTWHPSKIMWGFGAVSMGLLLSSLSIVSRAKVATAIMVILIPFLDGFITIVRRMMQKKNPFKGDRGHLHHLLLERGWSQKKVAVFYWAATAFFGIIGILSADKSTALVTLTLSGLVALIIVSLNVKSGFERKRIKKSETDSLQQLVTE